MDSKVVNRNELELEDDPSFLSPPIVEEPLYQCATAVTVYSYVPDAEIEIEVDGSVLPGVPGSFPLPNGVSIPLPDSLIADQIVRARQITAAATSDWSIPVTVRNHTKDYPAGPPRPEINPAPVYRCGSRTGVNNLLIGGNVWITADSGETGRVNGCEKITGVDVNPDYGPNQHVRAWFELCNDPSPPSKEFITQIPPKPLPTPGYDQVYEGSRQITITNIVNGARVTLSRNGINQGTSRCWGGRLLWNLDPPLSTADSFDSIQAMCPEDPGSQPGKTGVLPCSSLPAPQAGPVQAGDNRVTLTRFLSDAIIKVYLNGVMVGAGSGPVVMLSKRVERGDILHVVQDLQGCKGQYALEIKVACVDPPVGANPAGLNLFPVGWAEYDDGRGIKGSVYYPAEDDGEGKHFNTRLANQGTVPIVFMAHGNHSPADPSFLGYDYFQQDLAKMGIIAVSVDCNALNGWASGVGNIEDRADLIISNIAYFQEMDADPGSMFFKHIDFSSLGLMGHSRGGDAVVTVPTVISLAGVVIKAVLALAPTNFRFWAGMSTIQPENYAFMTILPAGDGDVTDNNGAQFYDSAVPEPFKSQLYVHYANHNFFNRQWLGDDSLQYSQPPVMTRFDHEQILTVYGCALFRATLLGHSTTDYLAGYRLPAGPQVQNVHMSFELNEAITADNFEDGNTINVNSLGHPNTQLAGMNADEYPFGQASGAFNSSFYGETAGMVVRAGPSGQMFRWSLEEPQDLSGMEIWIRAAEVTDGTGVPAGATGFKLGLEDRRGFRVWVDSDEVGGLPRPYARNPNMIKTMLNTMRFNGMCFAIDRELDITNIQAVLINCDRRDERAFAYDDLQIVKTMRG
ncbi:hypothetical protein ACSAZL_05970 [Methanosarcina sp. T3]|uniref:hypothetical protein n=1 Tax=Methanosarcina sp. T3 TaxID=3439062 RepID=UPI003F82FE4B